MFSCQKDSTPDIKSNVLFSVDLASGSFNNGYEQAYLAAYTPDGELLGYGNLTDSTKWDLVGKYTGDKIDILFIDEWHESYLAIYHYTDVPIGQSFTGQSSSAYASPKRIEQMPINPKLGKMQQQVSSVPNQRDVSYVLNLKVEDFGNRYDNTSSSNSYESYPYFHSRGIAYPFGELIWDKVENGYTFMQRSLPADSIYQGFVLNMLDRETNDAYSYYSDQSLANLTIDDTLTLHKSDFTKGLLRTIDISSSSNDFNHIFLYTYNTLDGKRDLITSFDDITPSSNEKTVRYFTGDNIPINKWQLSYNASFYKTSYSITSNMPVPNAIEVKEMTGQSIRKVNDHFEFTHSNAVVSSPLVKSVVLFFKETNNVVFAYNRFFEGSQSSGTSTFKLYDIPAAILADNAGFTDLDANNSWIETGYYQSYTNISGFTPIDDLKARLDIFATPKVISEEYAVENFSIGL